MKEKSKDNFIKRIFRRKKLLILLLVLGIIIFGVLRWRSSRNTQNVSEPTQVQRGKVTEELVLSGSISADEYAALAYPVSGRVVWVGVKEGDKVVKGQALGKLDTVSLNASYQQSLATLRAAEASLQYVHDQVKDNDADETFAQKDTRTTAEVVKDKAYEGVKIAEDNLKNATLRAPFSGIITSVASAYAGINTLVTQTQFEVINPETMYLEVTADQTEVVDISEGQRVTIVLDAYPDETFIGTVSFVSFTPRSGDVGTSYEVKIKFDNSVNLDIKKFRMGMGADVKFILHEVDNVLYLPPKYVKNDSKGSYVNLERKNNKVYIETGLEGEDAIEIKSGLTEGQLVFD